MTTPAAILQALWKFVRGDSTAVEFERWVYGEPELEMELGKDLYLATISTNFSNKEAVWALRCALAAHARARSTVECLCIRLKDMDVVDMGTFDAPQPAFERDRQWSHEDVFRTLQTVKEHGAPLWWLFAARCRACGQAWLVGAEERQNDVYCMKRLDPGQLRKIIDEDRWPPDFEFYETLLRIGLEAGRRVLHIEPMASSMDATIADLARARPGIGVSEIAKLLNVDVVIARELARRAIKGNDLQITFDAD
jgi:hypothetical protein